MQVTFILKDKSDAFYNGSEFLGVGLLQQTDSDKFQRLCKLCEGGMATMKVGDGSFRDKVELNQTLRHSGPKEFKLEPRKGYKLATFQF